MGGEAATAEEAGHFCVVKDVTRDKKATIITVKPLVHLSTCPQIRTPTPSHTWMDSV